MKLTFREREQGELNLPLIYFIIMTILAVAGFVAHHLHLVPVMLCPFKEITGLPCPTCGTTRVVLSIYELDLWSAFLFNPGLFLFLIAMGFWFALGIHGQIARKVLVVKLTEREKLAVRWTLIILFLANWLYLWKAGI